MKKGFLIFIISCIVLLLAGVAVLAIGLANGGSLAFNIDYGKGLIKTAEEMSLVEGSVESGEFSNVDIDIDAASIRFVYGSGYSVKYKLYEDKIPDIEVDGNTLKIKSKKKSFNLSFNTTAFSKSDPYIEITVPEGTKLSDVKLNVDYGDVQIDGFEFDSLSINDDAGNAEISDFICGKIDMDLNYGNLDITGSDIEEFTVNADAGNIEVSDTKIDKIDINNDYGDVDISLNAEEADYDIDIEIDFGDLSINGKKYKSEYKTDNGKDKEIKINADSGDVSIEFK